MVKKITVLKPVKNNGTVNSDLQFNVVKSLETNKKVKPKQVFEYNKKKVK